MERKRFSFVREGSWEIDMNERHLRAKLDNVVAEAMGFIFKDRKKIPVKRVELLIYED